MVPRWGLSFTVAIRSVAAGIALAGYDVKYNENALAYRIGGLQELLRFEGVLGDKHISKPVPLQRVYATNGVAARPNGHRWVYFPAAAGSQSRIYVRGKEISRWSFGTSS